MRQMENELPRQERLEKLFDDLVKHIEIDAALLREYAEEVCDIYSDLEFRHSYSEISLVLEKYRPDQRDTLSLYILSIREIARTVLEEKEKSPQHCSEVEKRIFKLCDHVDLECLRLSRIERVEYIGKTATNELSAADGKLREAEERAEELSKRVSGYHDQNIAILGIFAGLVVTFSGVIQITSSSLENLSEITTLKITFFVCLSFFFLFDIVFLLMYCISKLSGSSIANACKKRDCNNCLECRTSFGRIKKKYPYVFCFNIIGACFCGILCYLCK